jgi:hypothetical protein
MVAAPEEGITSLLSPAHHTPSLFSWVPFGCDLIEPMPKLILDGVERDRL